jgi:hypothetical protein
MSGEFSVYQWFEDGSYIADLRFVSADEAMQRAVGIARSIGGRLGTTTRVIITDGGDCIVWEWKHGVGVVFPKAES